MDGWMWFSKSFWVGGGGSERILGCVHVRVNLGSRPSICPHLYPELHVKAFWAHHTKSPRVWKWKRKCDYESISTVNTHTHSHRLLHTCSFTPSRLMSAAQLLRLPKQQQRQSYLAHHHMGVSTVTDGGLCIPVPGWFQVAPSTDSQNRQADRQAGSVIHANILKYMAGKLPPSRGQIGWTCRFNCSELWKSAAEWSFNQLHRPFAVVMNCKLSKWMHLTRSVKYLGLIYPNTCILKDLIRI